MNFSDDELERYARHLVLREIGAAGQARLKAARVAVVGVGGIGCPALTYLAAAGVGQISIYDDDLVSISNLQRQILFAGADIGRPKVDVAVEALARLNPYVFVTPYRTRLAGEGIADAFAGHDVILDGTDSFASRLTIADAALQRRVPLVSAALGPFDGQLAVYRGWEESKPCYRCLVGEVADRDGDTCAEQGVLGALAGVVGSMAALEVIRAIAPFGADPAGKLVLFDALDLRMRTVTIAKEPTCRCGG